jgi:hypothetical protein
MTNFPCDHCGGDCDDYHQVDNGEAFVCEVCYLNYEVE